MTTKTSAGSGEAKQKTPKRYQGLSDLFTVREDLNIIHKTLYISVVFFGLVLVWYGVWTAVGSIWLFREPAVAIISGVVLLLVTGKIKDLT